MDKKIKEREEKRSASLEPAATQTPTYLVRKIRDEMKPALIIYSPPLLQPTVLYTNKLLN